MCIEIETLYILIILEEFNGKGQLIFKDRIENFDVYYPCKQKEHEYKLFHNTAGYNYLFLLISIHIYI
jgi:hypothetical protein